MNSAEDRTIARLLEDADVATVALRGIECEHEPRSPFNAGLTSDHQKAIGKARRALHAYVLALRELAEH